MLFNFNFLIVTCLIGIGSTSFSKSSRDLEHQDNLNHVDITPKNVKSEIRAALDTLLITDVDSFLSLDACAAAGHPFGSLSVRKQDLFVQKKFFPIFGHHYLVKFSARVHGDQNSQKSWQATYQFDVEVSENQGFSNHAFQYEILRSPQEELVPCLGQLLEAASLTVVNL